MVNEIFYSLRLVTRRRCASTKLSHEINKQRSHVSHKNRCFKIFSLLCFTRKTSSAQFEWTCCAWAGFDSCKEWNWAEEKEREKETTIYFAFSFIFIRLFLFFSFRWHVIRLTVLRYIHTFIQTVSFSLMPRFSSLTYWTYNRLNQHEQHLTYTHHSSHFNHTLAIYFYSNGIFLSHSISFNLSAASK